MEVVAIPAKKIDGKAIATQIRQQVANKITQYQKNQTDIPHITTVIIGDDPSSKLYLKLRENACKEVGITTSTQQLTETISEQELRNVLKQLNQDPQVHGILVQFPLPKHLSASTVMNLIHPHKDVEGLNPINLGRIFTADEHLLPCTPKAVLAILEHEQLELQGKHVVIVNHSIVVGKPLTMLCLNRNATVSTCHIYTTQLQSIAKQADILITAAGKPGLITSDHVKQESIIIDVGITPTKQGIRGDVLFDEVAKKAAAITPVPGGVGPVTIACSLQNMLTTYQLSTS